MRLIAFLLLAAAAAGAQQPSSTRAARTSPWFNPQAVDFAALTPTPPAAGSKLDRQDMESVMLAQRTRTAAQVHQAQADDKEEDIFIFATVLGSSFNAAGLPLTAALSQHLREASAVINPPLKVLFARPRPFVASTAVHPVCDKTASNSFPSGHSMIGTLEALALMQIIPERSPGIQQRLEQYMGKPRRLRRPLSQRHSRVPHRLIRALRLNRSISRIPKRIDSSNSRSPA